MVKVIVADSAPVDEFLEWLGRQRCINAGERYLTAEPGTFLHRRQMEQHWVIADACDYLSARERGVDVERLLHGRYLLLTRLAHAKRDLDTAPNGRSAVPGRFAELLIGGAGPDYVHELISAAGLTARGCSIDWLGEDSGLGEFTCDVETGRVVHVECKRLLNDALQTVKEDAAATIGDVIAGAVAQHNLVGEVHVAISAGVAGKPTVIDTVEWMAEGLAGGEGVVDADGVELKYRLETALVDQRDFAELIPQSPDRYVMHAQGSRGTLTITLQGPQRDAAWLVRKVIDVAVERAADSQLPEDSPGLVCLELPFFSDAEYIDSLGEATEVLFERRHVIALLGTVHTVVRPSPDAGLVNSPGRFYCNKFTNFPAERDAWQRAWHTLKTPS